MCQVSLCRLTLLAMLTCMLFPGPAQGASDSRAPVALRLDGARIEFSRQSGSILSITANEDSALLRGGPAGLWQAKFVDGSMLNSSDFSTGSPQRSLDWETETEGRLGLRYRSPEIEVLVEIDAQGPAANLKASVTPRSRALLEFALPAQLRFNPDMLERLVCPADGNQAVGVALLGGFFKEQAQPTRWSTHSVGSKGYTRLFGGPLVMRDVHDAPTQLQVTDEGGHWLGEGLSALVRRSRAKVNRAPRRDQVELVLVDSEHGPYFSAKRIGEGRLWRVGGFVGREEEPIVLRLVSRVLDRLATGKAPRLRLGLIDFRGALPNGSSIAVAEWQRRLRELPSLAGGKVELVALRSLAELDRARNGREFLAIVNPYGEAVPVPKAGAMPEALEAISRYVRSGGEWFEVGAFPFFQELRPEEKYQAISLNYPPALADFFHLESRGGTAAVYRVQPRSWEPWHGAKDLRAIFVPGRIACGGDAQGGWLDRPYVTHVARGQTWKSPTARIAMGGSAAAALQNYAAANGIHRRLEEKMDRSTLDKFRRSVLVYYAGSCREKLEHLDRLPIPALIHFADYLKGGFDKQYPDHLPPRAEFGTAEEFAALFTKARSMGHLVMPYTNPTWWCDQPRGPTFERHGDEPLLRNLDGKLSEERYASNVGFTICHWHPAVQAANRLTRKQFTRQYPVDVLFQDQCGARGWRYDLNPASPTPYAYVEGLLSMVDEDSRLVPLSTESGWDRVVNSQSQLCGMTWSLVPTEHGPAWRQLMKERFDPATWKVFPMIQHLAHDKAAMVHHDLGQFVTNQQVLAWTLGLGYSLSYRVGARQLAEDGPRGWLLWLDRLQKSVCARYVGEKLEGFEHHREPSAAAEDDGLIDAQYGPVRVVANLDPKPRQYAGHDLPAFGFAASAPGLAAGSIGSGDEGVSFVSEAKPAGAEVWIYAPAGKQAAAVLPTALPGPARVTLDDGRVLESEIRGASVRVRLPERMPQASPQEKSGVRHLWHITLVGAP